MYSLDKIREKPYKNKAYVAHIKLKKMIRPAWLEAVGGWMTW